MRHRWLIASICAWLTSGTASANTDINGLFDARSSGMGATGVAFIDSAAAIPINPAALDQIDKLALTLDGTLIIVQPQAPYRVTHANPDGGTYENYETIRFDRTVAPLVFAGGAYRVHERVVLGAAVYPMIGMGTTTKYRPAPELMPRLELDNQLGAGLLEIGIPVSVRILDNLSVAAMWRVTYMSQTASQPVPGADVGGLIFGPSGEPLYAKLDVSGWNFGGLQLGVLYRPLPFLRFGLSYRSKVVANGTGTTTSTDPTSGRPIELDTRTSFTNPNIFRAGAALGLLQDHLLLAVDAKYLMYAEAYKTIDTTVFMNGAPITNSTPTHWKDAYSVHLGGEYVLLPRLRVRAGYELVMSATPRAYAQAAMAPPGASHAFTLGLGIAVVDHLSVDLAAIYIAYETRVKTATPNNAGPGIYASNTAQLALSASYRM